MNYMTKMKEKVEELNSWEDFEQRVTDLSSFHKEKKNTVGLCVSNMLFRGQSDAQWHLETTLERYLDSELTLENYYRIIYAAKSRVETFTEKNWDIPTPPKYDKWLATYDLQGFGEFIAYEYMAYLRHHGFPSPLLDWTASPYVAAYFAFREITSRANHVAIFAYIEDIGQGKGGWAAGPSIRSLGPYISSHKRHFLQQSQYTISTKVNNGQEFYSSHQDVFEQGRDDQDLLWKFILPSRERMKALKKLELYNISAYSLVGSEESLMEAIALHEFFFRDRVL